MYEIYPSLLSNPKINEHKSKTNMNPAKQDVLQSSNAVDENMGENGKQHSYQMLSYFPRLLHKSPEELKALDRRVVRKLDWQFLPCVTMMLLMR